MPSNAFADKNVEQSATCGIAVPASFVMKMPISHYFLVSDRHCGSLRKSRTKRPHQETCTHSLYRDHLSQRSDTGHHHWEANCSHTITAV